MSAAYTYIDLNHLEENWDRNRGYFLAWLEHCVGYETHTEEYRQLEFVIQNDVDLVKWLQFYEGNIDEMDEVTYKFRMWKLTVGRMDLESFKATCALNLQNGIETLFVKQYGKSVYNRLRMKLQANMVSLEQIYELSLNDPWFNDVRKFINTRSVE